MSQEHQHASTVSESVALRDLQWCRSFETPGSMFSCQALLQQQYRLSDLPPFLLRTWAFVSHLTSGVDHLQCQEDLGKLHVLHDPQLGVYCVRCL